MGSVASQLPPWAVYLLLGMVGTLVTILFKIVFNRYQRLERRVDTISSTQDKHITREEHDKEIVNLTSRWHMDFKELQSQIAESNKQVHARLDDLHVVLLNLFSTKKD